jgi:hypothetical protein
MEVDGMNSQVGAPMLAKSVGVVEVADLHASQDAVETSEDTILLWHFRTTSD